MNSKRVNWLYLSILLLYLSVIVAVRFFGQNWSMDIALNFVLNELIILIPAVLFLVLTKGSLVEKLGLHKIKISTAFMVVLFTFLTMPLTTVINAISMLFVENVLTGISDEILNMPFFLTVFLIGVYAPVCEELVFRGAIYRGYRTNVGILKSALVSAILFGLIHMNFNQAPYAMVIGIALALLVETTGSIYASILFHVIFNTQTVCLMYLYDRFMPGMLLEQSQKLTTDDLIRAISVYLVIAAVATTLAGCVLVWIARNEGRSESLKQLHPSSWKKGGKIVTLPLIIAVLLAFGFMILETVLV